MAKGSSSTIRELERSQICPRSLEGQFIFRSLLLATVHLLTNF